MDGTPFGRYRLVELLGRGGMGEVWRAHDTVTDRVVAIKVLPAILSEDEDFQRRFRREAHAAARLDSPHVVPIHDYGEIDGRLFVSMRLIEGRDLDTVLADGPLEPGRAVRIIEQVAKALHAAHEVGLIHRDIKPSNILLDHDDFAYLIDFGIARATDDTRLTKTGGTIGTFAYIAPERLDGRAEEDARADIYSLACVLYEALTGEPPFPGGTTALMYAHAHTPPPRPSATQPDVPPQVDEVIATGMAKDPDQRYATTIELANAARDAVTVPIPRPAPTATQPPTELSPRPWAPAATQPGAGPLVSNVASGTVDQPTASAVPPKRRVGLIAAIVVIVALVGAGTLGLHLMQRAHSPADQTRTAQSPPPSAPAGSIVKPTKATVFSPNGYPDNPGQAGLAIDGDPSTSWQTENYADADPFPRFQNGVGLMLQLPMPTVVGQVNVDTPSTGTKVDIRAASTPSPGKLEDTTVLAPAFALKPGHNVIPVKAASPTSYLLVWISTLGTTDGKNRADISEITVQAAS